MGKMMMAVALAVLMDAGIDVRTQERLNDGQVLALFDEANTADIWTARLALSKSRSDDVRRLASMVIDDHEAVQHAARELAKRAGLRATPPADDQSAGAMAAAVRELQSKPDRDFDRAYLAHELAFHRSAIDAVRGTLLPAATNAELKALLTEVLGGFENHLAETRRVAEALGVR